MSIWPRLEKKYDTYRTTRRVAYRIIGGGEEGVKYLARIEEEADHSLPYLAAVALLDGAVGPAQYAQERSGRAGVQALLRKVRVCPDDTLSKRFPVAIPCRLRLLLRRDRSHQFEKEDFVPAVYLGAGLREGRVLAYKGAGRGKEVRA